jgi:hypothetical protein
MVNPAKVRRVKTSAGFLFVVYLATLGASNQRESRSRTSRENVPKQEATFSRLPLSSPGTNSG